MRFAALMSLDLSRAILTEDGVLTGMSTQTQTHPRFGTDAYEARVEIPLTGQAADLAHHLQQEGGSVGRICVALRSTLGQLQCEAFGDSETQVSVAGGGLQVVSLMTTLGNEHGPEVIRAIRRLSGQQRLRVAHAGIFPEAAKVRALPLRLRPVEYRIDYEKLGDTALERILAGNGSGRTVLHDARSELRRSLGTLSPREFFLGQFDLDEILEHHVIVEPASVRGEAPTGVIHGSARLFHADRNEPHRRQAEIWNSNGEPEPLEELMFTGTAYQPSLQRE